MPKEGMLPLIKYAPPPSRLPIYQRVDPRDVSFFGRTNYEASLEEKKFVFGIKRLDRRRHMYVIGKAGVGKTKLLELLIRQDIAYGYGLCLVASHEDLITSLLDFIPEERVDDVVLVDLADSAYPVSFNPLASVPAESRHQFTQGLIEIFSGQFADSWSGRLEHLCRMLVLALLDYPHATMRGMVRMLTEEAYRHEVVRSAGDGQVRRFWLEEFPDWKRRFDAEVIIPLLNKLGQMFSDPSLKFLFSQEHNAVDLVDIMRNQKIVFVNLAKTRLVPENAQFFGSLFLLKLKQAGAFLAATKAHDRRDFYLYIDEVNYLNAAIFESFLTDAGKCRIPSVIAHQYVAQLSTSTLEAVFGNVGTMVVFRIAGADAATLEKELAPVFGAKDMINLGEREFYIKMMIDGNTYDPFSAETLKVFSPPHESFCYKIIALTRTRYCVPAESIKEGGPSVSKTGAAPTLA